eukprot:m.67573 g.67573  ORF g.67573 m.67573 type:complete len:794 (+) comp9871_c0_seq1:72-2453(+)
MAAADPAHLAALVERLRPMVSSETRALLKPKAKGFAKVCADIQAFDKQGKFVCCTVVANTPPNVLQSVQRELWNCLRQWLEHAMPPGKRDEVRDEDGLITEVIKALRQLRKYWLQTGDYGAFFGKALVRLMKSSNATLTKIATKVGEELSEMCSTKTHYADDDQTPKEIAEMYAVNVDELVKLNDNYSGITRTAKLEEGTKIVLPPREKKKASSKDKTSRSGSIDASSRGSQASRSAATEGSSRSSGAAPPLRNGSMEGSSKSSASGQASRGGGGSRSGAAVSQPSSSSSLSRAATGSSSSGRSSDSSRSKPSATRGPTAESAASVRAGKQPAMVAPVVAKAIKIVQESKASKGSILSQFAKAQPTGRPSARRPSQDGARPRPAAAKPPAKPSAKPTASTHGHIRPRGDKITVIEPKGGAGKGGAGPARADEPTVATRKRPATEMAAADPGPEDAVPKRVKRSVRWGDGWSLKSNRGGEAWKGKNEKGLVQIKFIPPRENKGGMGQRPGERIDMRTWEIGDERQHLPRHPAMQPAARPDWSFPRRFAMPRGSAPDNYLDEEKRGSESIEKHTQEGRERLVLRTQYFAAESIPPSAAEPDPIDCMPTNDAPPPVRIPLDFARPQVAVGGGALGPGAPFAAAPVTPAAPAQPNFAEDELTSLVRQLVDQPDVLALIGHQTLGQPQSQHGGGGYSQPGARGYDPHQPPAVYPDGPNQPYHEPYHGRYDAGYGSASGGGGGAGGSGSAWGAQHAPYPARQGSLGGADPEMRHSGPYGGRSSADQRYYDGAAPYDQRR